MSEMYSMDQKKESNKGLSEKYMDFMYTICDYLQNQSIKKSHLCI